MAEPPVAGRVIRSSPHILRQLPPEINPFPFPVFFFAEPRKFKAILVQ
jgi:hypothetical protein